MRKANESLEIRVRHRTAELEKRNEELRDFIHIASHDFQEPLRKIVKFGDHLKNQAKNLDEDSNFFLTRMQSSSFRMQELMKDLLEYSKVLSLNTKEFRQIFLEDVVMQVFQDLEVQIEETGGTVEVNSLPTVEADLFQMTQLFQNLISNSLKYSKKDTKSKICIEGKLFKDSPEHCEINIIDNGIGFDEQYIDKIFKPFARLHGPGKFKGTGLGLTLCKKIMEYYEGTITAKSSPGKGSTVTLKLPLKQQNNDLN